MMIQEVGVDLAAKCILWVKAGLDDELLFLILDSFYLDGEWRYWIKEHGAEGNIVDTGEEIGQMETEVKIAFSVSHNVLTIVEEHVQ